MTKNFCDRCHAELTTADNLSRIPITCSGHLDHKVRFICVQLVPTLTAAEEFHLPPNFKAPSRDRFDLCRKCLVSILNQET